MVARHPGEAHRASTPLELLFDLCFVVAVAQAAGQLSASLAHDQIWDGLTGYGFVFFAIWWAWMNFTWFASAYDTDDIPYRLLTFLQIVGVLVLAAGIPTAFRHGDFTAITIGYVMMRCAMVAQWLRAAAGDPVGRPVALRYAAGVTVVQLGWIARLFLPSSLDTASFLVLAALELVVPLWAERAGRSTTWHAGHISERYGLFTLIVLGECIGAATIAIQAAITAHGVSTSVVGVAAGGLLLVFASWWWYFEHPVDEALRATEGIAYVWGYAHYGVFGSIAALGAGLEVAAEATLRDSEIHITTAAFAVAVPVVVFLAITAALHARLRPGHVLRARYAIVTSALVLAAAAAASAIGLGLAIVGMGLIVVVVVIVDVVRDDHVHTQPAP